MFLFLVYKEIEKYDRFMGVTQFFIILRTVENINKTASDKNDFLKTIVPHLCVLKETPSLKWPDGDDSDTVMRY